MASTSRTNGSRRSTASAVPAIRIPRQSINSNEDGLSKVKLNYPILFVGTLGVALLVFWHRMKTKDTYSGEPVLTVRPSTSADMSQVQNIQNLVEYDVSILDKALLQLG